MSRTIKIHLEPDAYFDDYEDDVSDYSKYDIAGDAVESWDIYCDDGACELRVVLSDIGGTLEVLANGLPGGIFTIRFPATDEDLRPLVLHERVKKFEFTRDEVPACATFSVNILPIP
jgi:hypothetical protein